MCLSHMKQIGLALTMYSQDWDETYVWFYNGRTAAVVFKSSNPPGGWYSGLPGYWHWALYPYTKSWDVFKCGSTAPWNWVEETDFNDVTTRIPDFREGGFGIAWAHAAGCTGYVRKVAEMQAPAATMERVLRSSLRA